MNDGIEILDAKQYFEELQRVMVSLPKDGIDQIADTLVRAYDAGRTVYLCGNGGSAALASHFACDLGKGTAYCNGGKRFRVLSLTDNLPTLTAWANDCSYEDVFSEQLRNFVQPHDVAFAISGSGNSTNVLNALQVAREAGATTVGISGFHGGAMKSLCDLCVIVPSNNMQVIEDLHLAIAHSLFRIVYTRMSRRTMTASCPG
ncbi:MAG: SIS domain-containing protein [Acidobacteriia bacterium]|nr:SIS domain-containing protein [Terriglobia bacterium]